jgi:hypothetical protein
MARRGPVLTVAESTVLVSAAFTITRHVTWRAVTIATHVTWAHITWRAAVVIPSAPAGLSVVATTAIVVEVIAPTLSTVPAIAIPLAVTVPIAIAIAISTARSRAVVPPRLFGAV